MVKHKGASNRQTGAYKPPKRAGGINKVKNKVDKKQLSLNSNRNNGAYIPPKRVADAKKFKNKIDKKQLVLKGNSSSEKILKHEGKEKTSTLLGSKSPKKIKKKKSLKTEKVEENSSQEMERVEFSGDISEQDINSDDDFSLDEDELPVPPDITTTEDESSEEEKEDNLNENEPEEIRTQKDNEEQRTIFVGNLPKLISKLQLKKWFSKYGTVEAVRLRCAPIADPTIPKKLAVIKKTFHEERSNIHGFVRFSTVDEANGALAANGQLFDDTHHLRVDIAGKVGQKTRYDDKKAVFIGNLPFTAEEDQLRDHFADCGDISCIRIVRDKHTAVGKGFAFINFQSRHSVRLALEKDGTDFNGRKLRIQKALYNQEVEAIPAPKINKRINNRNDQDIGALNIMKFKKKKKNKSNEQFKFQGLSFKKDVQKCKKIKKKKKQFKQKKEVLKKVLNTEGKNKNKITF